MPKRNSSCNLSQYVWRSAICDLAAACSRALANNNKMNAMGGGSQSVSACCQNMPGRLIHATEQAVADALAMAFREQVKAGFCQAPVCVHHMRSEHRQEIATPECPPQPAQTRSFRTPSMPTCRRRSRTQAAARPWLCSRTCEQYTWYCRGPPARQQVIPRMVTCSLLFAYHQSPGHRERTCGEGHAATWTRERDMRPHGQERG